MVERNILIKRKKSICSQGKKVILQKPTKSGKVGRENIAKEGIRSTERLEEAFSPKLPNRFASTLVTKLAKELLESKNFTEAKGQRLPNLIEAKRQKLPDTTGVK